MPRPAGIPWAGCEVLPGSAPGAYPECLKGFQGKSCTPGDHHNSSLAPTYSWLCKLLHAATSSRAVVCSCEAVQVLERGIGFSSHCRGNLSLTYRMIKWSLKGKLCIFWFSSSFKKLVMWGPAAQSHLVVLGSCRGQHVHPRASWCLCKLGKRTLRNAWPYEIAECAPVWWLPYPGGVLQGRGSSRAGAAAPGKEVGGLSLRDWLLPLLSLCLQMQGLELQQFPEAYLSFLELTHSYFCPATAFAKAWYPAALFDVAAVITPRLSIQTATCPLFAGSNTGFPKFWRGLLLYNVLGLIKGTWYSWRGVDGASPGESHLLGPGFTGKEWYLLTLLQDKNKLSGADPRWPASLLKKMHQIKLLHVPLLSTISGN